MERKERSTLEERCANCKKAKGNRKKKMDLIFLGYSVDVVFYLAIGHNKSSCSKTDKRHSQNEEIRENCITMNCDNKNTLKKINCIISYFC